MEDTKSAESFTDLKGTDIEPPEGLMERLREAAKRPMSREEIREQKISFVTGMLPRGSSMTRKDVADLLDREYA